MPSRHRDGISTYPTTKKMLSFHFALKQQQSTKSVKTQKTFFKAYWNEASGTVYHFNVSTTYTLAMTEVV